MGYYVGLDVSLKRTHVFVLDTDGVVHLDRSVESQPEAISLCLDAWADEIELLGLETGSTSPWLARSLLQRGFPVVVMDARRVADALKSRPIKTDRHDARALAEMLMAGWFTTVHVKSETSHRQKALLSARDQLVQARRSLCNQVRGLLRPFGIRLACRQGSRQFETQARQSVENDPELFAIIDALFSSLEGISAQIKVLDKRLHALTQNSSACHYMMSVPGVGPVTALAFASAIEDPNRFRRARDVAAYLGLVPRRYQSGDKDVSLSISKQGDHMARHYLYEAANCLLTTAKTDCALRQWGRGLIERLGAKRARVAVARKIACLLFILWKSKQHFLPNYQPLKTS